MKKAITFLLAFMLMISSISFTNIYAIDRQEIIQFMQAYVNELPVYEDNSLNEVKNLLPKLLKAINKDNEEVLMSVEWKCSSDFENDDYYVYMFQATYDKNKYKIPSYVKIPYYYVKKIKRIPIVKTVIGGSVETEIYNFLINNLGVNNAIACGILANIEAECNYNINAYNSSEGAYGICQWRQSRYDALVNYCNNKGYQVSSLTGQLNYMKYELSTSEINAWNYIKNLPNTQQGAYDAAYFWAQKYERCHESHYTTRANRAKDVYWWEYQGSNIDSDEMVINDYNYPTRLYEGHGMNLTGTISAGQSITRVEAGAYDLNGNRVTGGTAYPNTTNYNLSSIDSSVRFSTLSRGMYYYKVIAYNAAGTFNLVNVPFTVTNDDEPFESGMYYIRSISDMNVGLDEDTADNIVLKNKTDDYDQMFYFEYISDGYYTIKHYQSGKYLTVKNGNTWDGANVQLESNQDADKQLWQPFVYEHILYFVPKIAPWKALYVWDNCIDVDDQNITIYDIGNHEGQKFYLTQTNGNKDQGNNILFTTLIGEIPTSSNSCAIDDYNSGRGEHELIVYNVPNTLVLTNYYGYEISVDASGKVIGKRDYGDENNLVVPEGGMVLSAHGGIDNTVSSFINNIEIGDYVGVDYRFNNAFSYKTRNDYLCHWKYVKDNETYGVLPVLKDEWKYFYKWVCWKDHIKYEVDWDTPYIDSELQALWSDNLIIEASEEFNNHTYKLIDHAMSWEEAKAECEELGGHLVTITSQAENDFIEQLIAKGNKNFYAIGLKAEKSQGDWKWINEENYSYENFDPDYPEGNGENEGYAFIVNKPYPPNKQSGEWIDLTNENLADSYYDYSFSGFICEIDSANDEEIQDEKEYLDEFIYECRQVISYMYEETSYKNFKEKLDEAIEVYEDVDATLEEVTTIHTELRAAKANLKFLIDKDEYFELVESVEELDLTKYTQVSSNQVQTNYEEANKIKNNYDRSEDEAIWNAYYDLKDAINRLELKPTEIVDKKGLQLLIDEAEKIDGSLYTKESINEIIKVLNKAYDIYEDETSSQSEVDEISKQLDEALSNLEFIEIEQMSFDDVKASDWFYKSVEKAYQYGLMGATGKGENYFEPDAPITRGMVATVLHRMAGKPNVLFRKKFSDVNKGVWYSIAITWAAENKVVSGNKDGSYAPDKEITRQDLAIMLRNYAASQGLNTSKVADLTPFLDDDKVASYAKSAIAWCVEAKLMSGTKTDKGSKLNPQANASRAECAKMFSLLDDLIK